MSRGHEDRAAQGHQDLVASFQITTICEHRGPVEIILAVWFGRIREKLCRKYYCAVGRAGGILPELFFLKITVDSQFLNVLQNLIIVLKVDL